MPAAPAHILGLPPQSMLDVDQHSHAQEPCGYLRASEGSCLHRRSCCQRLRRLRMGPRAGGPRLRRLNRFSRPSRTGTVAGAWTRYSPRPEPCKASPALQSMCAMGSAPCAARAWASLLSGRAAPALLCLQTCTPARTCRRAGDEYHNSPYRHSRCWCRQAADLFLCAGGRVRRSICGIGARSEPQRAERSPGSCPGSCSGCESAYTGG